MLIPVRCFTCGKCLADKWHYFDEKRKAREQSDKKYCPEDIKVKDKSTRYFEGVQMGDVLDQLGLKRQCCRSVMLSSVDLMEII